MSVRHLEALFQPASVAVIGASDRPGSVGAVVWANLRQGGFAGPLWPVNQRGTLHGQPVAARVQDLPGVPELVVVCTPAATVPGLIADCGRLGVKAAVVLTAGLRAPAPEGGGTLEQAMLDAARPHLLRILGPNCLGLLVPGIGLNASFAPSGGLPGQLAFVTQSGALATAMLDWAGARGIGFSHYVSLGDGADVDFGDMLDWLASDAGTRAILLYVESVRQAAKFMSAARAASRNKPVILVKAGRRAAGARAAASHTGALAGSDAVFDAAVRRAGMLRVDTLEGLFDAAQTLARVRHWRGPRLAILTNGGGAGVLAADALEPAALANLEPATLARLDACLPATWSRGNPVDIIGDAPVQRYLDALAVLLAAPEVDGVLFMHAPTAIVPAPAIAQAALPQLRAAGKPVLACWLGGAAVREAALACERAGIATFDTPERAVAGWQQLVRWQQAQQALLQLPDARPAAAPPETGAAAALLQAALDAGQTWLPAHEVARLLGHYGIPMVATRFAGDPETAAQLAGEIGGPVALKIQSPDVVHKSEAGGVALDLRTPAQVREAALAMRETVLHCVPGARIDGWTVQAMAQRPRAWELIAGIADDPVFGPVVLFGEGGTAVEVRQDRALALPPLNEPLARDLVARTRVAALLAGFRDRPPVDEAALLEVLQRVAALAAEQPLLAELDLNPLLADAGGVLVVDARVKLRRPAPGEGPRLALRPYPRELEGLLAVDGRTLPVRPIRPEDGARLARLYDGASAVDRRLRFFLTRREVPASELARYCQIDYAREMTFVALDGDALAGEVRAVCDPDNETAEFAILVAGAWQRRGLGAALLGRLVAYLRSRGTGVLLGECLEDNHGMAALARNLGFDVQPASEGLMALRLPLR